jgi:nitrite reductase/ring-hydroxylating ferredoxin subunit
MIETHGVGFIREGLIDDALRKLIPRAAISRGHFAYPSRSELRDLVWNHMDQNHRAFIHRTYSEASRVFLGPRASFSLTRFGGWPIVIPVFDGYYKENGFYQIMVLFGLLAVVNIIECNPTGNGTQMDVEWAIASHRWLRFLHPLLNRRFVRLNEVQNAEDDPIRDRRIALRAAGYRFKTDDPDFVNSNLLENNAIFPPLGAPTTFRLSELPEGQVVPLAFSDRELIVRRGGNGVEIWPGVCPHEGARLGTEHLHDRTVKCPWHGLEFAGRRLEQAGRAIELCGVRIEIVDDKIEIGPLSS